MKSPFPGMDPYLEEHWPDVHTSLVSDARSQLNRTLPQDLVASTEERIAIETEEDLPPPQFAPDVHVRERGAEASLDEEEATAAIAAPYRLVARPEALTERFIRITEKTGRLIAVIEFLSPAN